MAHRPNLIQYLYVKKCVQHTVTLACLYIVYVRVEQLPYRINDHKDIHGKKKTVNT